MDGLVDKEDLLLILRTLNSANIKDTDFVADLFIEMVEQVGAENIIRIITSYATNFKEAKAKTETEYLFNIFYTLHFS